MGYSQWIYDLSFCSREGSKSGAPEIVFALDARNFGVVEKLLLNVQGRTRRVPFLRGDIFGYGKCGHIERAGLQVRFHIELRSGVILDSLVQTIDTLLSALHASSRVAGFVASNREQQLFLQIGYGAHGGLGVGGWVYETFGKWLGIQGENISPPKSFFSRENFLGGPLPERIQNAMSETWQAIAPRDMKRYANECYAGITPDGRFCFKCFGNACDVSIYPDQLHGKIGEGITRFGCHNLDARFQMMTLLAGVAALCGLAEEERN
jgi:hypothetical protein